MRFVKRKREFGLSRRPPRADARIARTASTAKGAVQSRRLHQFVRRHDVDYAFAGHGLHHVVDIEHRLAEELIAALDSPVSANR